MSFIVPLDQEQPEVQKARDFLAQQPDLKLAWVFGSFARGKESKESDLDVAVAGESPLPLERRVDLALALGKRVGREIDLIDLQVERGLIVSEVLTRGKLLFKKDGLLLARLIKRFWYDREDFWPQRDRILRQKRQRAFRLPG